MQTQQLKAIQLVGDETIHDILRIKKELRKSVLHRDLNEKLPKVPYEIIRIVLYNKTLR